MRRAWTVEPNARQNEGPGIFLPSVAVRQDWLTGGPMPKPPKADTVARICLVVGLVIWLTEITLRRQNKITMHQFTTSMLIPIGIMAYGLFVRWRAKAGQRAS